ncbi:hypothetical protein FI667_g4334, partial [Globisporangium splendens]
MTKQRDILKVLARGRVKRLLREQKDIGQVGEPALQCCGAQSVNIKYRSIQLNLTPVCMSRVCPCCLCALVIVLWCGERKVAAMEAFVRDLGAKLKAQTEQQDRAVVTPVELKQVVLANDAFVFLQDKVTSIDESDAKYHKAATANKKKKRTEKTAATTSSSKRSRDTTKSKASSQPKKAKTAVATASTPTIDVVQSTSTAASLGSSASGITIEEDDDYDESDSD